MTRLRSLTLAALLSATGARAQFNADDLKKAAGEAGKTAAGQAEERALDRLDQKMLATINESAVRVVSPR